MSRSQTDPLCKILQPIHNLTKFTVQEIKHGSFVANIDPARASSKKEPMESQSVVAQEHIIYAIRAKLCSCATGQVERCALADTLSCSVSGSPLSLGLIVSVHLRRGCHASVCSAAPTAMSNWRRAREKQFFSFHCVTVQCQEHISLCFSSFLLLNLFAFRFVVFSGVYAWQEHAAKNSQIYLPQSQHYNAVPTNAERVHYHKCKLEDAESDRLLQLQNSADTMEAKQMWQVTSRCTKSSLKGIIYFWLDWFY